MSPSTLRELTLKRYVYFFSDAV